MANLVVEPWYKKTWRPASAAVYLFICIVDFVVMPFMVELSNTQTKPAEVISSALQLKDSPTQLAFINAYSVKRTWDPLTLRGTAAFHLAFGALLTGAAVTRGLQQKESAKQGTHIV
jgi:hypothetical protein